MPADKHDCVAFRSESNAVETNMNAFSELEYECFNLFKKYCNHFSIDIEMEEDPDVCLYAAKQIQNAILSELEDSGLIVKRANLQEEE